MSVVAIIPARSGSKRLPGKNIMELDGRPMLAYSILVARATSEIQSVWVTTDSGEYARIAEEWGAQVVMRPPDLAADDTSTLATIRHALQHPPQTHYASYISPPDWVVLLQPNCPLRMVQPVSLAIEMAKKNCPDGMLSVELGPFKTGTLQRHAFWHPKYRFGIRKQDMPIEYREDGNLYVFRTQNIIKRKRLHGKRMGVVLSAPDQSLANVDTPLDMDLTRYLFQRYGYADYFAELERQWKPKRNPELTLNT